MSIGSDVARYLQLDVIHWWSGLKDLSSYRIDKYLVLFLYVSGMNLQS